jgi:sugar diacid utilization regulator
MCTSGEEREQQQRQVLHAFMHDLLHPTTLCAEAALQKRACTIGWNLAAPHLVVSMQLLPLVGNSVVREDERLARTRRASAQMKRCLQEHYPGSLTDGDDEQLLCLLRLETERAVDMVNQWFDELAELLHNEQHIGLFAGISTPCYALSEYRRGYAEAQEALQVVQWLKQKRGSATFNELGVYRYLYRFAQENTVRDQYQAQITILATYDRQRKTNLLATLEAYLEGGTNIARASSQLHIHRNTMLQRLERIQSLCSVDLEQHTNWLPLLVAIKLYQIASHVSPNH